MPNINIFDHNYVSYDTGVNADEVLWIHVDIISGDEILEIHKKDGTKVRIDSENYGPKPRVIDYYDGGYFVMQDMLEAWLNRKNSYDFDIEIDEGTAPMWTKKEIEQ